MANPKKNQSKNKNSKKSNKNRKKSKKKDIILLIILIAALLVIDYPLFDYFLEKGLTSAETGIVSRIIDGDTIKVGNETIRLLGINAPEKGQAYYTESKEFLENLLLNKTINMQRGKEDTDQYNRKLRYVFFGQENVNLNLVKVGFANYYFPSGKDKYYNEFQGAWQECIDNNRSLCIMSKNRCSECINIKEFNHKEQKVVFENTCTFYCNLEGWSIKDEGRKTFIFPEFYLQKEVSIIVGEGKNTREVLYWKGENYVWTPTGDTLFLRDKEGKLVLWESY